VKSCVAYTTKKNKILPRSPAVAIPRIAPKIYQGQPAPDNVLSVLRIPSKSVHFWRSYIRTRERRQSALESESNIRLKTSFEPNKNDNIPMMPVLAQQTKAFNRTDTVTVTGNADNRTICWHTRSLHRTRTTSTPQTQRSNTAPRITLRVSYDAFSAD